MFKDHLPYSLVHVRHNELNARESHSAEYIFRFHRHNVKSCIKYIMVIKDYGTAFLTFDFYPKINFTP